MFSISPSTCSSKRGEAKHKTPYSFRSEVAFIYFKAKLLGELEISPENLDIFNFATLVTFQEHSSHRNLLLFCVSLS